MVTQSMHFHLKFQMVDWSFTGANSLRVYRDTIKISESNNINVSQIKLFFSKIYK